MKISTFILFFFFSLKAFCQYGVIYNRYEEFGPCDNYLNAMEYKYSFKDLLKDTLRFPHSNLLRSAEFIQDSGRLLQARLFDQNGKIISSGNLKNGDGKLVVDMPNGMRNVYSFKNGKLNDTTFYYTRNRINYRVYKANIIIYRSENIVNKIEASYDDDGFADGNHNIYGKHRWFIFHYDSYNGKLYQSYLYEHGNLISVTLYKKDGSVKKTRTNPSLKKINYIKKSNKNCL